MGLTGVTTLAVRVINRLTTSSYAAAGGILVLMMFFTAADVILRYGFNRPILGSLELTEFMMAIITSIALALAALRKGHVSVDVVISRLPERVQAVINSITCFITLGVFAVITWGSISYARALAIGPQLSPAYEIPLYPFVWAVTIGSIIFCLILLIDLVRYFTQVIRGTRWHLWVGLIVVIALVLALFASPVWGMGLMRGVSPAMAGIVGTCLLLVVLFSGMPVGVGMALVGFLGMVYINSMDAGLSTMSTVPYRTLASYNNSVVPLFILMGVFCFYSGLSKDLFSVAYKWIGRFPGGLSLATIAACGAFSAISGASVAATAVIGAVALPEMKRYKYDDALATGCIAAGGTLDPLIPPSVIMVIYGILTTQSIGKLFLAGFIPGIILAIFFMIAIYIQCKRNPFLGPPGPSTSFREKITSLKDIWGVLALFILVIGGLYLGIFTPTEAAGIGACGAFIYTIAKRKLTWQAFKNSLLETGEVTGMAVLILMGGLIIGYFFAVTRLPFHLADMVVGLEVNRYIIIGCIIVIYMFLGCIMSALAMIMLTVPIFFPVILTLGFDPIWFGIVITLMAMIGQITPPVGISVYVIKGIAKDVPMYTIFRGVMPFFIADLCLVALIVAFPQIVLFIPDLMK